MAAVPIISESSDEAVEQKLECGCCYESENLRRLTCNPSHVFCVTCIRKDSVQTSIIRCPLCRLALSIPSAGINQSSKLPPCLIENYPKTFLFAIALK